MAYLGSYKKREFAYSFPKLSANLSTKLSIHFITRGHKTMRISALDALADDLGVDGAIHLLERIVPLIKQRQDQLQAALQNGDSTAASQHAHKMIGSVRTYGSAKLEAVLARIRATGEESNANIADLQREFTAEFDAVAQGIQQWLDQHRLCADRA